MTIYVMTTTLRTLRRSRGLTLTELAVLSGIPARNLGAIELGILSLDAPTRTHLARVLAVAPQALPSASPSLNLSPPVIDLQRLTIPIALALATTVLTTSILSRLDVSFVVPSRSPITSPLAPQTVVVALADRQPEAAPARSAINAETLKVAILGAVASTPVQQASLSAALFETTAEGGAQPVELPFAMSATTPATTVESKRADRTAPRGYPLIAPVGQIVVTQGYGTGTHAPAAVWGALDFAIDADSDGYAEPGPTRGAPVIATHDGIARVYPGSWPGGNFVRIENRETGWTTAYGHLDSILVRDGQEVWRGDLIGTVGSTGYATGPHLHYEVWQQGINVDPTPFVGAHSVSE
ncbi:peptidoglycan DD-metalloendopeptidase family protein [Roseiflexus castenholzii]|jgi:transcriptional regulator with XRE-family HTH domain|uniref:Transcriptional regulator, XRE family n=1 Tax=Roseiflexus castenholzii (strain DSM 13941 / HLO8) TaxID=383372 RepID=A7NM14_ROSCS|nr:peptidoglycan DD-metalloendopeptidase family protein [Roseiflexus castenholzii]ABU58569.1 transcriptional regulator, XRE family [Roseiflexus castenholzii DSM 13941]